MQLVLFNPLIGPLSGVTTPGQSGSGRDGNEGVLLHSQKLQYYCSDCLVSYPGHSLVEYYPSAEKLSVYSTAQAYWARYF